MHKHGPPEERGTTAHATTRSGRACVCVCVYVRAPGPSASSGSRRSGGQGGELRSGSGLWMDSRRGGMYLRVFGACPEESFLDYSKFILFIL